MRALIERGELRRGDRLPAERDLAAQIGVSRPTVRAGLRALAAMGVVRSRHGSGTFIPDGPPALGSEPLSFLAALHGFTRDEMYEARRILEVGAAGLAAERATPEQTATLADEVAGLFASLENPAVFLVHDINFHRSVAAASGNPIVGLARRDGLGPVLERRRDTAARATGTSATRPKPTGRSTRPFAATMPKRAPACTRISCRRPSTSAREGDEGAPGRARQARGPLNGGRAPGDVRQRIEGQQAGSSLSMFDLSSRTAVVVGGTSGIGRVVAPGFADAGADAAATARLNLVDDVATEIERRGAVDVRFFRGWGTFEGLRAQVPGIRQQARQAQAVGCRRPDREAHRLSTLHRRHLRSRFRQRRQGIPGRHGRQGARGAAPREGVEQGLSRRAARRCHSCAGGHDTRRHRADRRPGLRAEAGHRLR